MTWALLHLRGCPDLALSFYGLRLVRELKYTPGTVSGLASAASGDPFARCASREISGVLLLEQESAASSVSVELVSMAEDFPERDRLLLRGVPSVGSSLFLGTTELRCVCGVRSGRSNIDGGVSKGILLADLSLFAEHLWDCKTSRRLALPDPQGSASGMIIYAASRPRICGRSSQQGRAVRPPSASSCLHRTCGGTCQPPTCPNPVHKLMCQLHTITCLIGVWAERSHKKHKKPERLTSPR